MRAFVVCKESNHLCSCGYIANWSMLVVDIPCQVKRNDRNGGWYTGQSVPSGMFTIPVNPQFPTTYSAIRPSFAMSAPSSLVTIITLLRNHLRSLTFVARPLTSHLFPLLFSTYWNAWQDAFQATRTRRCAVKHRRVYSSKCEDCAHSNWNLCPQ